jgi:ABC-2 type transport system ATP-binding protein
LNVKNRHIIEVEHLVKKFGRVTAVNDVSFWVESGEVFGFLGPNGAGKTTTINVLCTLLTPISGRATVNGFDTARQKDQVRQSIGLVFQDPSLDDRLTALQNLNFHASIYNVPAEVRKKRAEEVLRMVELWERRNHEVRTFSGGMKRRLELARGLLHYPRILFLDEPTLGLDPQTRNSLWEYILDRRKQEGMTIFLTTHYMDEAAYADRIAVIDYGKIIALDSPEALKGSVGKDIISLKTGDDEKAAEEIKTTYQVDAKRDADGLTFEVANGAEFIPGFVTNFKTNILSINLRRPTLDDVFLKLTGRQIRDGEADGTDMMKDQMRAMGRSRMRH